LKKVRSLTARIIALGLNCGDAQTANPCCQCSSCKATLDQNSFSVIEVDGARTGNIDTMREILDNLPAAPMSGDRYKILIIDEAHLLSDKSQSSLLKTLEDNMEHVYIILCTNLPEKLKDVTKNRCKIMQFNRLLDKEIYKLLSDVAEFEGMGYKKEILDYIVEESYGIPRQSLSYLQQINADGTWTKDAASLIVGAGTETDQIEVFEFCQLLLKSNWKGILYEFKKIKTIPPETIRIIITGFMAGCLRNSKNIDEAKKFSKIVDIISVPYYGPKQEHVLTNSLFKIMMILRGKE
jgi:DNA polymerase-3 subunit gamma/tau